MTPMKHEGLTEHEKSVGLCILDSYPKKLADEASSQHRCVQFLHPGARSPQPLLKSGQHICCRDHESDIARSLDARLNSFG